MSSSSPPPKYRNSLEEEEALDLIDPLRHLLQQDEDDRVSLNGDQQDPHDQSDQPPKADQVAILPQQRRSIKNERAIVRYYRDGRKRPITFNTITQRSDRPEGIDQEVEHGHSHYDVILKLDVTEGCGGKIWPAAEVLGAYISSKHCDDGQKKAGEPGCWKGKQIIELGTGTGLVGLLVARMGIGAKTWITDQIPMLQLMRDNLALNQPLPDECIVEELNWGEPIPASVPPKPDILLLADCVYLEVAFQPLVDTMAELSDKETEILFCYQKRRKADKRFFTLLKKKFNFEDVEDDDPVRTEVYRRQGTQLLRVFKK
ncbi:hypothetical protein IE53DRAFT_342602 [Violaceomyces palustris]|uniref:Uncharacterized protein n=1 Tax=Violaceomyces palustris TaxID=1673888 RepID=A0ACD0NZX8_9BASI|nr:hypothetical protein IE53DRAFT_342602 [Violaceomyces palustris]